VNSSEQHSTSDAVPTARAVAQRLQLLLSWKERLALQTGRNRAVERQVDAALLEARKAIRAGVEHAGIQLQSGIASGVDPARLDRFRHAIAQGNLLLKVNTSADLGGFVDLPLAEYPTATGVKLESRIIGLTRDDFFTILATLIIAPTVCLAIAWYYLWRVEVEFFIDRPSPRHVTIRLQNNSSLGVEFLGAWPESDAELPTRAYGVSLYCRTTGEKSFQECTNLREVWSYQRQALSTRRPLAVEAGTFATITLDLDQLQQLYGAEIKDIRIDCGSPWRKRLATFTEPIQPQEAT